MKEKLIQRTWVISIALLIGLAYAICIIQFPNWDLLSSYRYSNLWFNNLAQGILAEISLILLALFYSTFKTPIKQKLVIYSILFILYTILVAHLTLGRSTITITHFSFLPNASFNWVESIIWGQFILWVSIFAIGTRWIISRIFKLKDAIGVQILGILIIALVISSLLLPNYLNNRREEELGKLIHLRDSIHAESIIAILQSEFTKLNKQSDRIQVLSSTQLLKQFGISSKANTEINQAEYQIIDSTLQLFQSNTSFYIQSEADSCILLSIPDSDLLNQFNIGPFEQAIAHILDSEPIMDSSQARVITEARFPNLFLSEYFFHFCALLTGCLLAASVFGVILYGINRPYLYTVSQTIGISRYGIGVQLIFTGFALVSLIFLAIILVTNFYEQNKDYRKLRLDRKAARVLKSWEANSLKLRNLQNWVENTAEVQGTDFLVYNQNGQLEAYSLNQFVQKNLLPTQLSDTELQAFQKLLPGDKMRRPLLVGQSTILNEYIASRYPKHYILSIPYLEPDKELKAEFSNFLNGFLKAYAIIFTAFILASLWITNRLSRPLNSLTENIQTYKIGISTSPLSWHQNDEIGELVSSYNDLTVRLNKSIKQLAEQEREGAWKLMARQIAHEVKNPLTPLKLNLQLLEYKLNKTGESNPDIQEFIGNLIKQVDHLTAVAESFANFSQISDLSLSEQSVSTILQEEAQLYSQENIHIQVISTLESNKANIDEKAFRQVVKNLITNSIQAGEDQETIQIIIEISKNGIEFQDNCGGIPIDQVDSIFQPNITSKSEGMGLGLSISKQLCKLMNGNLALKENTLTGCVFMLEIRIY